MNPSAVDGDEKVGQSIQLTIDGEMQNALYNYMESMGMVGSVVVLRTDGSLMAEVSAIRHMTLFSTLRTAATFRDLGTAALANKAFRTILRAHASRSCPRLLPDMNGITCLYDEGTWEVDGATIVNWDHDAGWYPLRKNALFRFCEFIEYILRQGLRPDRR